MIKVNDVAIDSDSEDDTLKDDEVNEVNSATTDVSHTTELLVDDANVVISSPLPTPCPDDDKSKINGLKKLVIFFLDISFNLYYYTGLFGKMGRKLFLCIFCTVPMDHFSCLKKVLFRSTLKFAFFPTLLLIGTIGYHEYSYHVRNRSRR